MALNTDLFPLDIKNLPKIDALKTQKTPEAMFGRSAFQGIPTAGGGFGAANVPGSQEAQLNAEAVQGLKMEQGTPNPSGFVPYIPSVYGEPPKPSNIGYYAQNRNVQGLPALDAATAATPALIAETPATIAPPAAIAPAPKEMSNFEKAMAYSKATGSTSPEVIGTRFKNAFAGLNDETNAQAHTTVANAKTGASGGGLVDLGETTTYNQTLQPETKTKQYGMLDTSGALQRLNLPTIAAKAPLPPKADLKAGQAYPGYGTWTGTGFRPQ